MWHTLARNVLAEHPLVAIITVGRPSAVGIGRYRAIPEEALYEPGDE